MKSRELCLNGAEIKLNTVHSFGRSVPGALHDILLLQETDS